MLAKIDRPANIPTQTPGSVKNNLQRERVRVLQFSSVYMLLNVFLGLVLELQTCK